MFENDEVESLIAFKSTVSLPPFSRRDGITALNPIFLEGYNTPTTRVRSNNQVALWVMFIECNHRNC